MNKSINFFVQFLSLLNITVIQPYLLISSYFLLPYYALLLCTLVVRSLFMTEINICLKGTPNPEEDTEL